MNLDQEYLSENKIRKRLLRVDGDKPISVISDLSVLRKSIGFWSERTVFFNPSESIVLLRGITVSDIRQCINRTLDANLENAVFSRLSSVSRKQFLHYFSVNALPDFQEAKFRVGGHSGRSVQVDKVLDFIKDIFPSDENSQKRMLAQKICSAYRSGMSPFAPLHMGADNLTALCHPGLEQILRNDIGAEKLVGSLAQISRYNTSWKKNKDEFQRRSIVEANKNSISALEYFGIDAARASPAWIVSVVASVRMLLALLSRDEQILWVSGIRC